MDQLIRENMHLNVCKTSKKKPTHSLWSKLKANIVDLIAVTLKPELKIRVQDPDVAECRRIKGARKMDLDSDSDNLSSFRLSSKEPTRRLNPVNYLFQSKIGMRLHSGTFSEQAGSITVCGKGGRITQLIISKPGPNSRSL